LVFLTEPNRQEEPDFAESALLEPDLSDGSPPKDEVDLMQEAVQKNKNIFDKTLDQLEKSSRPLFQWWSGSPKQVAMIEENAANIFPVLQQNWYFRRSFTNWGLLYAVVC
jgi:hypothetical protein